MERPVPLPAPLARRANIYDVTRDIDSHPVGDYATLQEAVDAVPDATPHTITVLDDDTSVTASAVPVYVEGKSITLKSDNGPYTLTQDNYDRHFEVTNGASLTLENIILEGLGETTGSFINGGVQVGSGCYFTMSEGAVIQKCYSNSGGGVYSSGTFNMSGSAKLQDNTAGSYGGGVRSDRTFTMSNGNPMIRGNTAGLYGGGVYNATYETFTMEAGIIGGPNPADANTATNGGGVYNGGTFDMSGDAVIEGNSASRGGGAYNNTGGTLDMGGDAAIQGNLASGEGGGVFTLNTFTMGGNAVLQNNTANDFGGGVYVYAPGTADIDGDAQIIDNTAASDGGGVGIAYADLANLTVGEDVVFSGNSAATAFTRDPADDTLYETNILATQWTWPFTQGYNNFDIAYTNGGLLGLLDLTAEKSVSEGELEAGMFEFGVFDDEENLLVSAWNDAEGLVTFPPIIFFEDGVFDFTVREISGASIEWVPDRSVFPVVVTVTENGGDLEAQVEYPEGEPSFTNTPPEECSVIEFPGLVFAEPGVYEYILRETSADGGGWETDTAQFRVTITVTDNGEGVLEYTIEYPDGFPEFTNTYTMLPARVVINALKFAVGAPLPCGRFNFGLFDLEDNLIAEASNGTQPNGDITVLPPTPTP